MGLKVKNRFQGITGHRMNHGSTHKKMNSNNGKIDIRSYRGNSQYTKKEIISRMTLLMMIKFSELLRKKQGHPCKMHSDWTHKSHSN